MSPLPLYNTSKRRWMQISMWFLLALGLATAMGLTQWRTGQMHVQLQGATDYGYIRMCLPAGWAVDQHLRGQSQTVTAQEQGGARRTLTITTLSTEEPMPPQALLVEMGVVPESLINHRVQALDLPEGAGIILQVTRRRPGVMGATTAKEETIGCNTYQDGRAVIIELTGGEPGRVADIALVAQIAESIKLLEQPQPPPRIEVMPQGGHSI